MRLIEACCNIPQPLQASIKFKVEEPAMQEEITKTKCCTKCKNIKPIDMFYKNKSNKDGLQFICIKCGNDNRQKNKEKIAIRTKAYYNANKDKFNVRRKNYYEANKEKCKDYSKSYYIANKTKISEYHRAYHKTETGKAVRKNKEHKRRTLKKKGNVTTLQMLDLQKTNKCYWCGCILNKNIHIDHYIPLSKGGEHTLSNLVVSCAKCNLTKHDKDPIIFAQSIGKLL